MAREQRKVDRYWFDRMDKSYAVRHYRAVISELGLNVFIRRAVKSYRKSFIRFCAVERMNYKPNIHEEFAAYHRRFRLGYTNPSQWEKIRRQVFERDGYTCQYCGTKNQPLEVDHVVPFSRGGGNEIENLKTACRQCNRQKRDMPLSEFLTLITHQHGRK
jgi:5-methylcytosine-specific restriction endonuclease McrA